MSLTYGFYNSLNGDRKYNTVQMSTLFDGIINDGVFMSIADTLICTATTGMGLHVGLGRAWFNHTWTNNDALLALTVTQSEIVLNRIDAVILEVNSNDEGRANIIKIIKGTPSSNPLAPTFNRTEKLNQYPLCLIYVGAGVTSITQANITNKIGTSECPFVTGILDTVDIDALLLQWNAQFSDWLVTIKDILDENAAGNLLNLIGNEVKIKTGITIPITGWTLDVNSFYKYDIVDTDILDTTVVDVNIRVADLDKASSLKSANNSFTGYVRIYADTIPTSSFICDLKLIRQVV